ncbi:hypothetical protein ASC73_02760 [Phenylobacterium sp. Root1277]|nr:hypothetical protein ASC73_02760 [Phenylobacterium sp. Root1277]
MRGFPAFDDWKSWALPPTRSRQIGREYLVPLYTIYPTKPDGVAATFEAMSCPTDKIAIAEALLLLSEHPTASHVVVWQGLRKVVSCGRVAEPDPWLA